MENNIEYAATVSTEPSQSTASVIEQQQQPIIQNFISVGHCYWCRRPLHYDCLCELNYDSDYADQNDDSDESYVYGDYCDDTGYNVRDPEVKHIYTSDWSTKAYPFLWDKFVEDEYSHGNLYKCINWNMFEINQYCGKSSFPANPSLGAAFEEKRYNAIITNLNILSNASMDTENLGLDHPDYYVAKCRYFTFLRWLILTPHFSFVVKKNIDMIWFNTNLRLVYEKASWLLDTILQYEEENPNINSIPNPYASTIGDIYCRDECVEQITEFIKLIKSILIIQTFIKKIAYKRKTIYKIYSFNTLRTCVPKLNLDCLQTILVNV